jgi:methanogenic corrinoid protein MtbC1
MSDTSPIKNLAKTLLAGDTDMALKNASEALVKKNSIEEIVVKGILKAWINFGEWYDRDAINALKFYSAVYIASDKVLKFLDSKVITPPNPPFSVLVTTVKGEGHIVMRDIIKVLLKSKGVKVHSAKKWATVEEVSQFLLDKSLKFIVLSCSQDETKAALDALAKQVRAARPDIKIVAGGPFAGFSGADVLLQDPTKLYDTLIGLQRE